MKNIFTNSCKSFMLALVLFLMLNKSSKAQQDPMFSQYMFNTSAINPAYIGSLQSFQCLLLSRHQWMGFDGAPTTQTFAAQLPINVLNSAVGVSYLRDKIGAHSYNGGFVDYAFRFKITRKLNMSMGLKGGFNIYNADMSSLDKISSNDIALDYSVKSKPLPNFGFGVFLFTDNLYGGISTPKLVRNELVNENGVGSAQTSKEERHFFTIMGAVFDVNENLKFRPSILLKYVKNAPLSVDLTAGFLIKEFFWLGGSYRVGDSFGGLVQIISNKQLRIGYAYEYSFTDIRKYNTGTHEIMIAYNFNLDKQKIKSPRYF